MGQNQGSLDSGSVQDIGASKDVRYGHKEGRLYKDLRAPAAAVLIFATSLAFLAARAQALSAPQLRSPANGATNQSLQPLLDWDPVSGAQRYRVFLDSDYDLIATLSNTATCSSCLVTAETTASEYPVPSGKLRGGTTYYWRVRAGSDTAGSPNSVVRSFTTALAAPTLLSPSNGATNQSLQPRLVWSEPSGALRYRVFLDSDYNMLASLSNTDLCSSCLVAAQTDASEYTVPSGRLQGGTTYYWRVRAGSDAAGSPNSAIRSFTTALAAPTLLSPSDGATNQSFQPRLDWSQPSGALHYRVFLDSDYNMLASLSNTDLCLSCLVAAQTDTSEYTVPSGKLQGGMTYYWRVRAGSNAAGSPNSAIRSFTTALAVPTLLSPSDGATNQSLQPRLDWSQPSGALRYRVFLDSDYNMLASLSNTDLCSSCLVAAQTDASEYTVPSGKLQGGTTYYWRVRAGSDAAGSPNSSIRSFATASTTPPPSPTIGAVSPSSVEQGSGGFWLNLDGSGFSSSHSYGYWVYAGADVHLSGAGSNGSARAEVVSSSRSRVYVTSVPSTAATGYRTVTVRYGPGSTDTIQKSNAFQIVAPPKSPPQGLVPADGTEGLSFSGVTFQWRSTNPSLLLARVEFTLREADGYNGALGNWVGDCRDKSIGRVMTYSSVSCGALQPGHWYKFFVGFHFNDGSPPTGAGGFFKTRSGTTAAFRFSSVPDVAVGQAVSITVQAIDANGWIDTSFSGEVALAAWHTARVDPTFIPLRNGSWSGPVVLDAPNTNTALTASAWEGSRYLSGTSNSFQVLAQSTLAFGKLVVEVRSPQGGPLSGVPVTVGRTANEVAGRKTSGTDGRAVFENLVPARYLVWTDSGTWGSGTEAKVEVAAGSTSTLTLSLAGRRPPVILVPGILGSTQRGTLTKSLLGGLIPILPEGRPLPEDLKIADYGKVGFDKLQRELEELGYSVYPAPWDWRVPAVEAWSRYLKPVIKRAQSETGQPKVDIVAHSMGGLVVRSYIQSTCPASPDACYENDIDRFIMVGTPNYGSAAAYYIAEGADPLALDGGTPGIFTNSLNALYEQKEDTAAFKKVGEEWTWNVDRGGLKRFINKEVPSVGQLLPVYTSAFESADPGALIRIYSELNPFLSALNSSPRLSRMAPSNPAPDQVLTRSLLSEQYATLKTVEIGSPGHDFYPFGTPVKEEMGSGDALVLSTLPRDEEELDDYFDVQRSPKQGHYSLINNFLSDIIAFLGGNNNAITSTALDTTDTTEVTNQFRLSIFGRVQPHVIAPDGSELGVDPVTGDLDEPSELSKVEAIPGSSGVALGDAADGNYTVELRGLIQGNEVVWIAAEWFSAEAGGGAKARALHHGTLLSFQIVVDSGAADKVRIVSPVPAPTSITVVNVGGMTRLSWQPAAGVIGYNIYGRRQGAPAFTLLGTTTGTSFDTGHAFYQAGDGEIWRYIVLAIGTGGTESFFYEVTENRQPVIADFKADLRSGSPPLAVSFQDASTGPVTSWAWDFNGDGTVDSTERNPTFSYPTAGTYTVCLTVAGPPGEDSRTRPGYITVRESARELIGLSLTGPDAMDENGTAIFFAAAQFSDGSTVSVTPVWSEDSPFAAIDTSGLLFASVIPGTQQIFVTATYSTGGVTRSAVKTVSLVERGIACSFRITSLDRPLPLDGGGGNLIVTTEPGCRWTAESQAGWISIQAPTGATLSSGEIVYSVAANNSGIHRQGFLTVAGRKVPVRQQGAQIAAALYHSLFLRRDGILFAWGSSGSGQLGDGTWIDRSHPGFVLNPEGDNPLTGVVAVAARGAHNLALQEDGTVLAWGWNAGAQLGDGTTTDRNLPWLVRDAQGQPLTGVVAIAAGTAHNLALREDGSVVAWGNNYFGQLGDGTQDTHTHPVRVTDANGDPILDVIAVETGLNHAFAFRSDGVLLAWGQDVSGQLGDGTEDHRRMHASAVRTSGGGDLLGVIQVMGGSSHSLALNRSGSLLAWGDNPYGQVGDGTTTRRLYPTAVSVPLGSVASVAAGTDHGLAVGEDSSLIAWGHNHRGQLGDGSTNNRSHPVQVLDALGVPLFRVAAAAGGAEHSLALLQDGTLLAWGRNQEGQLGDGTNSDHSRPVAVQGIPELSGGGTGFYTLTPCRAVDTRSGAPLTSGAQWTFHLGGVCGVPASATAVSVNVTAVANTGSGYLVLWPADLPKPETSVLNFMAGQTRANNAILPLASDGSGTLAASALIQASGTVHVIVDVNGYFQ